MYYFILTKYYSGKVTVNILKLARFIINNYLMTPFMVYCIILTSCYVVYVFFQIQFHYEELIRVFYCMSQHGLQCTVPWNNSVQYHVEFFKMDAIISVIFIFNFRCQVIPHITHICYLVFDNKGNFCRH